jgi:hypothetical protein
MHGPWNHWYHCMCNTYGTWLPGDPRGFRTRHHRLHVDGDYKNPPPAGRFDDLHRRSGELMRRRPVYLTAVQIPKALDEILASLGRRSIELVAASLDDHHFHLLARFPDHRPRHWLGIAKKESSHFLGSGGLWAVRGKILPVRDRAHQVNVARYILSHASHGAATWRVTNQIGSAKEQ